MSSENWLGSDQEIVVMQCYDFWIMEKFIGNKEADAPFPTASGGDVTSS